MELLKEKCCCLNGKSVVIYLCCKFSTSIIKKWYKFDNFVKNLNSWLFYKAREGTYWQKCRVSKNWKEAKLYKNKKIMDDPWRKVKEKDTKITNRHTENNRLGQRTLFVFFSLNFVNAFFPLLNFFCECLHAPKTIIPDSCHGGIWYWGQIQHSYFRNTFHMYIVTTKTPQCSELYTVRH